jgi:hypothetical protein
VDEENTRTEPEEDAGDTTDGALEGELSQFVEVFAWQDDDQDGIFDGGETPLYIPPSTPGHLFNPEGFIPVGDTDVGAFIPAGQTRYIGIAWCVGEMDDAGLATMSCDGSSPALNVAQTDIMSVSITAFAEQVRNNADFQCSNDLLE